MLGFNGGLIGATRSTSSLASAPGVWTAREQLEAKRNGLWSVPLRDDANYSSVSLLLPFNGSNGSTVFTDWSQSPKAITKAGDAQISTAQSKYYGSSIALDGSGDYLTTPYTLAAYDWWVSDYTAEAWAYPVTLTGWSYTVTSVTQGTLLGNASPTGTTNFWSFGILSSGQVRFSYFNGSSNQLITSSQTVSAGQWSHVALTKTSSGIILWVNGVGMTAVPVSGTPQSSTGQPLTIGSVNNTSVNGYINDLRITKGVARYTANFTPPDSFLL